MQIQNNVFIVTGGASGLGAATARMLVAAGGKVVLADVQVEAGETLAKELGGQFVKCDVTSEADAKTSARSGAIIGQQDDSGSAKRFPGGILATHDVIRSIGYLSSY